MIVLVPMSTLSRAASGPATGLPASAPEGEAPASAGRERTAVPLPACDGCGALALDDTASLVSSSVSQPLSPPRRVLLLPGGRALHGNTFFLCGSCARQVHAATRCRQCDEASDWGYFPLFPVIDHMAEAMRAACPPSMVGLSRRAGGPVTGGEASSPPTGDVDGQLRELGHLARELLLRASGLLQERAATRRHLRSLREAASSLARATRAARTLASRLEGEPREQAWRIARQTGRALASARREQVVVRRRLRRLESDPVARAVLRQQRSARLQAIVPDEETA